MKRAFFAVGLVAVCVAWAVPAAALVICQKHSGIIALRDVCKSRETEISSATVASLDCPPDSVRVGSVCVDKYEAIAMSIPVTAANAELIEKVKAGDATFGDAFAGGGLPLGCDHSYQPFPSNFPPNGNWTPVPGSDPPSPGVYALSLPGVYPTGCISWFQAAQACALSGKHLITNREWQDAAAGTPDPGNFPGPQDCNTADPTYDSTVAGTRSLCRSSWGVFDMVGNIAEYTAEWYPASTGCPGWSDGELFGHPPSDDLMCLSGAGSGDPTVMLRGGAVDRRYAGVFALGTDGTTPFGSGDFNEGFRCAR